MKKINIFNCNPLKEKTAVALGIFDGVHIGHRKVIKKAVSLKKSGLTPAVFTFDTQSVVKRGQKLLCLLPSEKKEEIFESLGVEVMASPKFSQLKDLEAERFVKEILVDKLNVGAVVCGKNFTFGKNAGGNCDTLEKLGKKYGFEVIEVEHETIDGEVVCSSSIRQLLSVGEISKANRMLGEPFSMELEVVHGNAIGRTWNFPTINQVINENQTPLKYGVYCSKVFIEGKAYIGVTNIGVKPTLLDKSIKIPLAETYILGFEGDLYGRILKISLYEFVREERRFSSFDELKDEISRNKEFTKNYFSNTERTDFNE